MSVAVVIPCFNSANFVANAARSAIGQSLRPEDVVVVDDASSDDPAAALTGIDWIRVVRQPENRGVSAARNRGAAETRAELLAFLDADDWWPDDLLERLGPRVRPGRAVVYDSDVVYESGPAPDGRATLLADWFAKDGPQLIDRENLHELFTRPSLFKLIVHREDFERSDGYDPRFRPGQDFHFLVKLVTGGTSLEVVKEPRGFYRHHGESALRTIGTQRAHRLRAAANWRSLFDDLASLSLPSPARREVARLQRYYRGRHVLEQLRDARLPRPSLLPEVALAAPMLARMAASGALRRMRRAAT